MFPFQSWTEDWLQDNCCQWNNLLCSQWERQRLHCIVLEEWASWICFWVWKWSWTRPDSKTIQRWTVAYGTWIFYANWASTALFVLICLFMFLEIGSINNSCLGFFASETEKYVRFCRFFPRLVPRTWIHDALIGHMLDWLTKCAAFAFDVGKWNQTNCLQLSKSSPSQPYELWFASDSAEIWSCQVYWLSRTSHLRHNT